MVVSLLWVVVAPVYARGLALIGRALIPVLETAPDTRYVVEGGRLLAQRPTWLAKQKRTAPLVWPIWVPTANYGVPLLAALILATRGWSWRRRGRALAVGLGLLTLTQIAFVLVTIVATQQSPVMSPDGMVPVPGFSAIKQSIFYALYYFFDLTGRGFFALIIYLGLIAVGWKAPQAIPPVPRGRPVGRNDPRPCGGERPQVQALLPGVVAATRIGLRPSQAGAHFAGCSRRTKVNCPSLPPNGRSAGALAEETGLPQRTLSRWLREAHKVGVMNTPARKWTLVEKLRVLIEASRLDESKLGEFLRREGVHEAQLKQWRAEVEAERWGGGLSRNGSSRPSRTPRSTTAGWPTNTAPPSRRRG